MQYHDIIDKLQLEKYSNMFYRISKNNELIIEYMGWDLKKAKSIMWELSYICIDEQILASQITYKLSNDRKVILYL